VAEAVEARALVPARRAPLLYFAFGHACLLMGLVTLTSGTSALLRLRAVGPTAGDI
jgi:hypothetical protein